MKVLLSTYITFLCNNNYIYFFPLTLRLYNVIKISSVLSFIIIIVRIQLFKINKCIINTFNPKIELEMLFLMIWVEVKIMVSWLKEISQTSIFQIVPLFGGFLVFFFLLSILGQWTIVRFWIGEMEEKKNVEKKTWLASQL